MFTNDLGLIAIVEDGNLVGFNVSVGGGLSLTHGNAATYSRLGYHHRLLDTKKMCENVCTKF